MLLPSPLQPLLYPLQLTPTVTLLQTLHTQLTPSQLLLPLTTLPLLLQLNIHLLTMLLVTLLQLKV